MLNSLTNLRIHFLNLLMHIIHGVVLLKLIICVKLQLEWLISPVIAIFYLDFVLNTGDEALKLDHVSLSRLLITSLEFLNLDVGVIFARSCGVRNKCSDPTFSWIEEMLYWF